MRTIKKLHKSALFKLSLLVAGITGIFFGYSVKEKQANPLASDFVNFFVTPVYGEGGEGGGCDAGDGAGCDAGGGDGTAGTGSGSPVIEPTPPPPPPPPSVQINFN